MNRIALRTFLVALVFAAACGGADTPAAAPSNAPTETPATEASAGGGDLLQTCVAAFTRQRDCTDLFIPALLDARVRLDRPEGIAARAEAEGKDSLMTEAMTEWESDSSDAMIQGNCEKLSADMPADRASAMAEAVGGCLAATECQAFVDCIIPVIEPSL